jgi:holo-[acyl-carrier protein] synthase
MPRRHIPASDLGGPVILGIGTDLIAVARIRAVHERQGQRFLDRIYTVEEQRYCLAFAAPWERLAARWAAKEAGMKALGTGWGQGVGFTDIAVDSGAGPPCCLLRGAARTRADALGVLTIHLSLTHSDGFALAMLVLEGVHPPGATEPSVRPPGPG